MDVSEKEEHNLAEFINNAAIGSLSLGSRQIVIKNGSEQVVSIAPQILKVICVNIFRKFLTGDILIIMNTEMQSCFICFNISLVSETETDKLFMNSYA